MPILVDYNQTVIAAVNISAKLSNEGVTLDMVRHLTLNSLLATRRRFAKDYGELIICCDGKGNWRKTVFPFYKANRAKAKESKDSSIDWPMVYECLDTIRKELDAIFPYKVVCVEGAEGDDVIGALTQYYAENELVSTGVFDAPQKTIIISTDGDFKQLQVHPHVKQYSPIQDKMLNESNPADHLFRKIIKGDTGDGVPNIKSPDDCLVLKVRQKPVYEKELVVWCKQTPEDYCVTEDMMNNYKRNKKMVDLSEMPAEIRAEIINTYQNAPVASRGGLLSYFIEHRLSNLRGELQNF